MFMTKYLSRSQGIATFEDCDGFSWRIEWYAYLQSRQRLVFTTGWSEFASDHNEKDGDILLLLNTVTSKFKFFQEKLAWASKRIRPLGVRERLVFWNFFTICYK